MKRLAALLLLIIIVGAGLYAFMPHKPSLVTGPAPSAPPATPPAPVAQLQTHGPRPLTAAEQAAFLPLVCGGAGGAAGGYAHQCTSLPGYPDQDYGGAGLGLGITLTSVVYGHLTSEDAQDAYVSYQGSFEPHVTNFGGGILFSGGPGAWKLVRWVPGGQADHCVSLNATGRARFVCLSADEEQGEADSLLSVSALPPPAGDRAAVLRGQDLRGTLNPNANCANLSPGQTVLLAIDNVAPAPGGASAEITYVAPNAAQSACAAKNFANAPTAKGILSLAWDGNELHIAPQTRFAPVAH